MIFFSEEEDGYCVCDNSLKSKVVALKNIHIRMLIVVCDLLQYKK